jgi:hypothetical protein
MFFSNWRNLSRTSSHPPTSQNQRNHIVNTLVQLDAGEKSRSITSHELGVSVHDFKGSAHVGCEVDLVYDQQIGLGNTRTAFPGDFIPALENKGRLSIGMIS